MKIARNSVLGALAVLVTLTAAPAHAYTLMYENGVAYKWPTNGFVLNVNAFLAIFQPTAWPALEEARDRWYEQPSYFGMSIAWDDDGFAMQNGESELSFHTDPAYLCGNSSDGCAYVWTNGSGGIVEADIFMRTGQTWTTSTTKTDSWAYGGGARLMQATLIHELGHAAGLHHEDSFYNVMGVDVNHVYTNGTTTRAYVGEDASAGVRAVYGTWGATDLGLVHWKWNPATAGVYSEHMRTQMFTTGNVLLGGLWVNNEIHHYVTKGQQYRVEFTFENNGSTTHSSIPVNYYLSTDPTITTGDTLLTTSTQTLSPDIPLTYRHTITVPANLTSGANYWIGAVIDPNNTVAEFNEGNNASYVGIRVL